MGDDNRRRYVKPAMTMVNLLPEEAVLRSCKSTTLFNYGPQRLSCNYAGHECKIIGS